MWTRKTIKNSAKAVLKTSYWKSLVVTTIVAILSGGMSQFTRKLDFKNNYKLGNLKSTLGNNNFWGSNYGLNHFDFRPGVAIAVLAITATVILFIIALGIIFSVFITFPILVSEKKFFIDAKKEQIDLNNILFSFNKGRYLSIVKGMAWKLSFEILWYMLFIIPGIVKSYAYSMVPFILAENPNTQYKKALRLSIEMTHGEKWNMFVLDLSFIGWYLLGTLALGFGILFVNPYRMATRTELYTILRDKAQTDGIYARIENM